ncbi:hypothetical protein F7725_025984 [Dissostichus mawsoni]|uniref:Uncharacterized protein n=1 Tax=Dissostichus mawsoni TaxID=36200 RepID=A0A7J5X6P6_DISMA|nr:hypothetical protein F7725_025984 [Dissostichus mawsoni]
MPTWRTKSPSISLDFQKTRDINTKGSLFPLRAKHKLRTLRAGSREGQLNDWRIFYVSTVPLASEGRARLDAERGRAVGSPHCWPSAMLLGHTALSLYLTPRLFREGVTYHVYSHIVAQALIPGQQVTEDDGPSLRPVPGLHQDPGVDLQRRKVLVVFHQIHVVHLQLTQSFVIVILPEFKLVQGHKHTALILTAEELASLLYSEPDSRERSVGQQRAFESDHPGQRFVPRAQLDPHLRPTVNITHTLQPGLVAEQGVALLAVCDGEQQLCQLLVQLQDVPLVQAQHHVGLVQDAETLFALVWRQRSPKAVALLAGLTRLPRGILRVFWGVFSTKRQSSLKPPLGFSWLHRAELMAAC